MRKTLFVYLILICSTSFAQKITISGFVSDAISAEKLIGATVYIPSLQVGTNTNVYGFYSLTIPENTETIDLVCSYISYGSEKISITPDKNQKIEHFKLKTKEEVAVDIVNKLVSL